MSRMGDGLALGRTADSQPSVVVELHAAASSSSRTRLLSSVFDTCVGPRTPGEAPAVSGRPSSDNGVEMVERTLWHTSASGSEGSYKGDNEDDELLRISPSSSPSCGPLQVAVLLVLLFTLICSWEYLTRAKILMWTRWMSQHRVLGRAAFVGAYILCLVLVLPGSVLSLLAGAIFGLYWGCLVVWLGNVIGQTLAFLLARFIFRDVVRHNLEKRWPKFYLIDAAIEREGWKLVIVLRLSPILPHTITNYVLGVTKLTLWTYSWSSALSVIPYVIVFVYIGCLTKNIFEILDGSWAKNEAFLPWGIFSGVVVLLMLMYAYNFTKRAMQHALMQAVTPSLTSPADESPAGVPFRAAGATDHQLTDRARLLLDPDQ